LQYTSRVDKIQKAAKFLHFMPHFEIQIGGTIIKIIHQAMKPTERSAELPEIFY